MNTKPTPEPIQGFHQPSDVTAANITLPVYVSEAGTKPLIVLHELPGMSRSFIRYCTRMADEGYKVYMPLMFKSPNTQMGKLQSILFCLSSEFRALFSSGRTKEAHARPITTWLYELVRHVANENPGAKIGVVGMCLTGGFSLATIAVPPVEAAIACQPSVPFFFNISTPGM